ncbi:MAG TPA: class I SAM-dependent methyltransferase [Gemmatimonadaceae bacterium]|nr:class I SAM-dependent methyltransferase [Gemmatimonadaceae bacterium]
MPRAADAPWWATYFDESYLLEFEPLFEETINRAQVTRLMELLELPAGARILDCPCGQGRHAHLLAEAGYDVTGVDFSMPLLRIAKARGTGSRLRYRKGDMRWLPAEWKGRFDAVLNLFTSFGFFDDPKDDALVIREFARMLTPGGPLIWFGGSRDGVVSRWVGRDSWETANGSHVSHDRAFDPVSGEITIQTTWRGPTGNGQRMHRIRLYTATRLAELCTDAGLEVEAVYDGLEDRPLRRTSAEMMLVARKPLLSRKRASR